MSLQDAARGVPASADKTRIAGTVEVTVVEARELPNLEAKGRTNSITGMM